MTVELLLVFALASLVFLSIPAEGTKFVIACNRAGGFSRAAVAGLGLAVGQAVTGAAFFAAGYAVYRADPQLLPELRWLATGCLILLALRLWRAPLHVGPLADNDNLPVKKSLGALLLAAVRGVKGVRTMLFLAAAVIEISVFAPFTPQLVAILAIVFLAATLSTSLFHAAFAAGTERLIRRRTMRARPKTPGKTVLISGRAVSAGYRRIAA
ncbi:hypothetical protein ACQ3G6_10715 [Allorhizobium undicola]|uniref:hypothetical protein n=1 Tax=Allorhizobium undicola TaxID=78527 RepID=UPI000ACFEB8D|nr:hypothetical protein [Allorhizobium undicola]